MGELWEGKLMQMSKFIRVTKTLANKGKLFTPEEFAEFITTKKDVDFYYSTFYYNDKHKESFDKTGSVAGITDVTGDTLYFDFDNNDFEKVRSETKELISRFKKDNITKDNYKVLFSGKKGTHVQLKLDREYNPVQLQHLALNYYGKGLTSLDPRIYNPSRVLRLPYSKHQDTGVYKQELSQAQLDNATVEEIQTKFKNECNIENTELKPIKINDANLPKEKIKSDKKLTEMGEKPRHWLSYKWSILNADKMVAGERDHAAVIIAATCRGLGYNREITSSFLTYFDERYATVTNQEPDIEKMEQKLDSVFKDGWNGGTYTYKNDPWIRDYCKRIGITDIKEESKTKKVSDLLKDFESFSMDFENNILRTGIKTIDDNILFLSGTHNGILGQPGCHAKDTGILMYDGTVKLVQDIKVGDLLMGPDSQSRKVLELCRGKDKMVEISPNKGPKFIINDHHILNLKPSIGTNNKAFECNLNIKFNDYVNKTTKVVKNRYKLNRVAVEFNEKELLINPYILGIWLGDGTTNLPHVTSMDKEVIDELVKYGKSIGDVVSILDTKSKAKTITFKGNNFRKLLREINVLNEKNIPQLYLNSSKFQRFEILAGLIDSDGTLDNNKTGFKFVNKNKNLADGVVYLARSLGFMANVSLKTQYCVYKGQRKYGDYYVVHISGDTSLIPTKILRKKSKLRKQIKDHLVTGFTYKYLGEDDYYGFSLNKDHLYLTEDFMVHHNSAKTTILLRWLENLSKQNIASMFYSLDMAEEAIYAKLVQFVTGFDFDKAVKLRKTSPIEFKKVSEQINEMFKHVEFNFTSGTSVEDIKKHILDYEQASSAKIKFLGIDYLECLQGPYTDSTANTGFISQQLKDLARELKLCSVILLQTQKHGGEVSEPLLSMKRIKGSSAIEQSASVVLTLWREGYDPRYQDDDQFISFAAVKNRFGKLWSGDFFWEGAKGQITSLSEEQRGWLKKLRELKKQDKAAEQKDPWD